MATSSRTAPSFDRRSSYPCCEIESVVTNGDVSAAPLVSSGASTRTCAQAALQAGGGAVKDRLSCGSSTRLACHCPALVCVDAAAPLARPDSSCGCAGNAPAPPSDGTSTPALGIREGGERPGLRVTEYARALAGRTAARGDAIELLPRAPGDALSALDARDICVPNDRGRTAGLPPPSDGPPLDVDEASTAGTSIACGVRDGEFGGRACNRHGAP